MAKNKSEPESASRQKLLDVLKGREKARKAEAEKLLAYKQAEKEKNYRYAQNENSMRPEKLKMSNDIFQECGKLIQDEEVWGQLASGHKGESDFELEVWFNGWGHKEGCATGWSHLYLKSVDGVPALRYWAGFKWMPTGPNITMGTPEELAGNLSHEYLKKLHGSLTSKGVYALIRDKYREVECMSKSKEE
jgi:hypothetical protein